VERGLVWYNGGVEGRCLYGLCAICTLRLSANSASVKLEEDAVRTVGARGDNRRQEEGI